VQQAHRIATSLCHGHVNELAMEPFLLLHREHDAAWNRLLMELKILRSMDSLRRDLKTYLFDSGYGHHDTE